MNGETIGTTSDIETSAISRIEIIRNGVNHQRRYALKYEINWEKKLNFIVWAFSL